MKVGTSRPFTRVRMHDFFVGISIAYVVTFCVCCVSIVSTPFAKAETFEPPKPKRKALATCVTKRATVAVEFYDYDEPDGDTILVTFNGQGATRLKLRRHAKRRFYFKLNQGKYNIIRIKNISNGFYPINTANVYIAGCGRARWKMKQLGVTRLIYIYRR